ncbi:MAG TPA: hypothetical protein VMW34_05665 [Anaerolineales bacterium]|nr:hypothetical protein [Anaerolineales bacterium]
MAGVITTGNHPKALWPGVKAWWGRTYNEHVVEYTGLFNMESSSQNYEEDVQVTGFGLAPVKPQAGGVVYDSESQGFTKRYSHVAYALGYITSYEELKDNLYEVVGKRRAQANAFSQRQTKETVAAQVYNRCVTAAYTGGDGACLLATDHPSKAGNWSNMLSTAADLSEASLEDICIQIAGATNDRGLKIAIQPQKLIIHKQDMFEVTRILKSLNQSNSASNDINALRVMNMFPGGIEVNHYLAETGTDAWFVRTNCPRGMIGYDRDSVPLKRENDFDTMNLKAMSYERYSFGWTDPRGLYGSAGA